MQASLPKKAPASSWYALIVLIIATILGAVDKIVLTLLTEPIRQTMSLSDTQIGLLQGAGLVLFTGLATLPLGWLSDRYDRRIVLAACIILWSAATGLRGTAETYGVLFIASIGLGMGEAGLTPITNGLIPDLFPRAQRVLANTIFALSTIFGAALGAFLGGTVVKQTENLRPFLPEHMASMEAWRLTFFVMAVVGIPVALLVLSIRKTERRADEPLTPETKGDALPMDANTNTAAAPAPAAPTGPLVSFGDHLRNNWRALSGLVIGFGLASIGQAAIGSWVPILAARKFGATPAEVGQGLGLAFLCGTVVGGFLGFFAIRVAQKYLGQAAALRVMMVGNLITACLSVLLLFVTSATQAFILMSVMVVPLISGAIAMPNVMQDSGPAHLRSRTIAVLTMASLPFGVLGPLAVGMLSDSMKDSPNGLAMAVVCTTLVGGILGAFVLKASERPFTKLMRNSQAANAAANTTTTTTAAA